MNMQVLNPQKLCLYDVEWQTLRVQLLGSWTNTTSVRKTIRQLESYLWMDASTCTNLQVKTRLWQVLNLLNAVRMSNHGTGHVETLADQEIQVYQSDTSDQYALYSQDYQGWVLPTEEQILSDLPFAEPWVGAIHRDLKKRVTTAIYKQKAAHSRKDAEAQVRINRPELFWFLGLLETHKKGKV